MAEFLLPYCWKIVGIILSFAGTVLSVFYIWFDFRFRVPVIALYSSYLETKFFTTFQTNFSEELTLFLLISGFSLIIFSREKIETAGLDEIRLKAFARAILINSFVLLFSVLFIYGTGFMAILVLNIFSVNILYLAFFYFLKKKGDRVPLDY
jgi:hypothetical protein